MKKKIILSILVILWMGLVFFFSNQKSVQSDKVSNGLISKVIDVIEHIKGSEFTDNELDIIYDYAVTPVRKTAHFLIYTVLGILVFNLIKQYKIKMKEIIIISILICLLYACTDEIHQLFVYGRSGELRDVLIDTLGSIFGIIITYLLMKKNMKEKVQYGKR